MIVTAWNNRGPSETGTGYGDKATSLFILLAEAIVKADNGNHFGESLTLANFKDVLHGE